MTYDTGELANKICPAIPHTTACKTSSLLLSPLDLVDFFPLPLFPLCDILRSDVQCRGCRGWLGFQQAREGE